MAGRRAEKPDLITLSSSSEEEEEVEVEVEDDDSVEEEELKSDEEESLDDETDDDDYEAEDSSESDEEKEKDAASDDTHIDDDSLSRRVINLLQARGELQQEVNLNECKAYLRKHGLRISGTKAECINRINEHWRIRDGSGEASYPRSSFSIDCTGDVCKGDVVLFKQRVYEKFDKVTRGGSVLGKRSVAGRVVKESYGASKQQHTFTVEVLWSKGIKRLAPLIPLLVKGRNLYRMKTFRQPWKNERERLTVLAEKHKRGAAARILRASKMTETSRKRKKSSSTNEVGAKRRKHAHNSKPSKVGKAKSLDKRNPEGRKEGPKANKKAYSKQRNAPLVGKANFEPVTKFGAPAHVPHEVQVPVHKSYIHPFEYSRQFSGQHQAQKVNYSFPSHGISASFRQTIPHWMSHTLEYQQSSHSHYFHHTHTRPIFGLGREHSNHVPGLANNHGPRQPFLPGAKRY